MTSPATWVFNFTFGADGLQLARGVSAPRGAPATLTTCVEDALAPVSVPPPGASVYVEIPLTLP